MRRFVQAAQGEAITKLCTCTCTTCTLQRARPRQEEGRRREKAGRSRAPEAPLGDLVPVEVALRPLLVHEHDAALLQVVPHLVRPLEVRRLARVVALLDALLDLLVRGRVRGPLAEREVRARGQRRVARAEEAGALLGDLHRELRHGPPLLLAERLVVGVNLLELRLGVLHGLLEGRLIAARDAERQGLVGLVGPADALAAEPRLAAVLLELRVLPDLPRDLDHAAAHAEVPLVLDAHLELARVLLGPPAGRLRRARRPPPPPIAVGNVNDNIISRLGARLRPSLASSCLGSRGSRGSQGSLGSLGSLLSLLLLGIVRLDQRVEHHTADGGASAGHAHRGHRRAEDDDGHDDDDHALQGVEHAVRDGRHLGEDPEGRELVHEEVEAGDAQQADQLGRRHARLHGRRPGGGDGEEASGEGQRHGGQDQSGDKGEDGELVGLLRDRVLAHVADAAGLGGEDVARGEGDVGEHRRREAEHREGQLRGGGHGDAQEHRQERGVDHGVEDLAEEERGGHRVDGRLQGLHDVGEGHGAGPEGRDGGHLPEGEAHADGRQLEHVVLRHARRRAEAGAPHEEGDGNARGQLDPRDGPGGAEDVQEDLVLDVVLDVEEVPEADVERQGGGLP
mmetsp:Transcript_28086/g.74280  ORF Transcript_28086/g.74280 Transcript_28086/m.74280 type:complete len:623 (-) Transcript_28086:10-1878(-)